MKQNNFKMNVEIIISNANYNACHGFPHQHIIISQRVDASQNMFASSVSQCNRT